MLYEPSYMQPYLNTIDASKGNTFGCVINTEGGNVVNAYNLRIVDLDGNQVYTSTKQTLTTPLYNEQTLQVAVPSSSGMVNGNDYVWNVTLYQPSPDIWVTYGSVKSGSTSTSIKIAKTTLISAGMYLMINNQKKLITSYDQETGIATTQAFSFVPAEKTKYTVYSDYITSNDAFFKAKGDINLAINPVPNIIDTKKYTFTATYNQEQGVNYSYFAWTLYDSEMNEIGSSGNITSGEVQYTFDGFISDKVYGVKLFLMSQDNIGVTTDITEFMVKYQPPSLKDRPTVNIINEKTATELSWETSFLNAGVATGDYDLVPDEPYVGGSSVRVYDDSYITWQIDPNYIDYYSTACVNWRANEADFIGDIIGLSTEKINLLGLRGIAPPKCKVGDMYFNIGTGLIHDCLATNIWSKDGYSPSMALVYHDLQNNVDYMWNGTEMTEVDVELPTYKVSYGNGKFYYDIKNLDVNISDFIYATGYENLWVLQEYGYDPNKLRYFAWDDAQSWSDELYWTDTTPEVDKWFKLTMLPTELRSYWNDREVI